MGYMSQKQFEMLARGESPAAECIQPQAQGMGALTLDSLATYVGTDRKTLLLVGGGALLAGWLLNNLYTAAGKTARSVGRKVRRSMRPKAVAAPSRLGGMVATGATLAIAGGAVWYFYQQYYSHASAAAPAPKPAPASTPQKSKLPVFKNGHWERPQ